MRRRALLLLLVTLSLTATSSVYADPAPYDDAAAGWSTTTSTGVGSASVSKVSGALSVSASVGRDDQMTIASGEARASAGVLRVFDGLPANATYTVAARLSVPTSGSGSPEATGSALYSSAGTETIGSQSMVYATLVVHYVRCDAADDCRPSFAQAHTKYLACSTVKQPPGADRPSCRSSADNPGTFTMTSIEQAPEETTIYDRIYVFVDLRCSATIDWLGSKAETSASGIVEDITLQPSY